MNNKRDYGIIYNLKNNIVGKHIVVICITYIMAHFLLLLVSGYWWDDAVMMIRDIDAMKELYLQTGSVCGNLFAYIMFFCRECYRPLVFLLEMVSSILLYGFLRKSQIFSEPESFWITLIFGVVPINDARITYICFVYTFRMFLFCLALFMTSVWKNSFGKMRWIVRIICWFLLFISYCSASFIVMSGIIILWLYYYDISKLENDGTNLSNIIKKVLAVCLNNVDYIIVPIMFWVIKILFFEPYGPYENYNSVSSVGVINAIRRLPFAIWNTFKNINISYLEIADKNTNIAMILGLISFLMGLLIYRKQLSNEEDDCLKRDITLLLIGFLTFVAGLFAYVVVGRTGGVSNVGVQGRDSLLLGFGVSIGIYFGLKVFLKDWCRYVCYVLIILFGIVHFNVWYLNYQREWYKLLEFEDAVVSVPDIKNGNTFWVIHEYGTPCGTSYFYNLNVNAYKVLGEQTRLFSDNFKYLAGGYEDFMRKWYGMDDYNPQNMTIDGIIILKDVEMSLGDTIELKWLEMTNKDRFKDTINNLDRYDYYDITSEQSTMLVDIYNSGVTDEKVLFNQVFDTLD